MTRTALLAIAMFLGVSTAAEAAERLTRGQPAVFDVVPRQAFPEPSRVTFGYDGFLHLGFVDTSPSVRAASALQVRFYRGTRQQVEGTAYDSDGCVALPAYKVLPLERADFTNGHMRMGRLNSTYLRVDAGQRAVEGQVYTLVVQHYPNDAQLLSRILKFQTRADLKMYLEHAVEIFVDGTQQIGPSERRRIIADAQQLRPGIVQTTRTNGPCLLLTPGRTAEAHVTACVVRPLDDREDVPG